MQAADLPSWDVCHEKWVDKKPMSALELFIYHNEPADVGGEFQTAKSFRDGLLAVINDCRVSGEETGLQEGK